MKAKHGGNLKIGLGRERVCASFTIRLQHRAETPNVYKTYILYVCGESLGAWERKEVWELSCSLRLDLSKNMGEAWKGVKRIIGREKCNGRNAPWLFSMYSMCGRVTLPSSFAMHCGRSRIMLLFILHSHTLPPLSVSDNAVLVDTQGRNNWAW